MPAPLPETKRLSASMSSKWSSWDSDDNQVFQTSIAQLITASCLCVTGLALHFAAVHLDTHGSSQTLILIAFPVFLALWPLAILKNGFTNSRRQNFEDSRTCAWCTFFATALLTFPFGVPLTLCRTGRVSPVASYFTLLALILDSLSIALFLFNYRSLLIVGCCSECCRECWSCCCCCDGNADRNPYKAQKIQPIF